jgi:glycosyltransferase involved in cell wall biosynthesis
MTPPRISVVIPLYNKEKYILSALECVERQTFRPVETIVIDDGSTDNGARLVEELARPDVILIKQKNAGVSAARNHGVELSKGEWVAFLDADDLWADNHLECLFHAISSSPSAVLVGAAYKEVWQSRRPVVVKCPGILNGVVSDYFNASAYCPLFFTSSVMVSRSCLLEQGGFPVGVTHGEDMDTWARLALSGDVAYVNAVTAIYNQGIPGQATKAKKMSRPPILDTLVGALASGKAAGSIHDYLSVNLPLYLYYDRVGAVEFISLAKKLTLAPFGFGWRVWRLFNAIGVMSVVVRFGLSFRFHILRRPRLARFLWVGPDRALREKVE